MKVTIQQLKTLIKEVIEEKESETQAKSGYPKNMDPERLAKLINPTGAHGGHHAPTDPLPDGYPALLQHAKGLKAGATRQFIIPEENYSPSDYPPAGRYYKEVDARVFMWSISSNPFYPAIVIRVWRLE